MNWFKQELDLFSGKNKHIFSQFSLNSFNKNMIDGRWYHVSDNPNLEINFNYIPRQGSMGKGFYVTKEPEIWSDGNLGKRPYTYEVYGANIATPIDRPDRKKLVEWGIENGYFEMGVIKKPDGSTVLDLNGEPLIRPIETDKFKKVMWQDPMTGVSTHALEHEYLKSKGFDGIEASYSPEGNQAIIFSPEKIKLSKKEIKDELV